MKTNEKMLKPILIVLIMLLVNFQSFSQIIKLEKGALVPYDTSAVMPINTYRDIRYKSLECDKYILASESEMVLKDSIISIQTNSIEIQQNYIDKNKFITKKAPYLIVLAFILGLLI